MKRAGFRFEHLARLACVLLAGFGSLACSLPNLEKPQCTQARDTVKQYYSWYIGTAADERARHPEITDKFVAPSFRFDGGRETDPFLLTNDWPKSFRVGSCTSDADNKATLQVVLLWRDDKRSDQKEVHADVVKSGDNWLIQSVSK